MCVCARARACVCNIKSILLDMYMLERSDAQWAYTRAHRVYTRYTTSEYYYGPLAHTAPSQVPSTNYALYPSACVQASSTDGGCSQPQLLHSPLGQLPVCCRVWGRDMPRDMLVHTPRNERASIREGGDGIPAIPVSRTRSSCHIAWPDYNRMHMRLLKGGL